MPDKSPIVERHQITDEEIDGVLLEPHHVECIKCGLVKATLRTKAKMRCDRGHHMWIFKKGELPYC